MKHVAIVEDDPIMAKNEKDLLTKVFDENKVLFSIDIFDTAEKFLFSEKLSKFDLVLLDIELPGENGMNAAREFVEQNEHAVIIFVTNMAQYAINGYEVNALDFIVKPLNVYEFGMKINRALRKLNLIDEDVLTITKKDSVCRVKYSDICFVETQKHRIIYHTTNGDIDIYGTMKDVEKSLSECNFVKCNRCYLVNLKYVTEVNKNECTVDGHKLVISRNEKKNFLNALTKYNG